jgi:DNA-binding transcriptional regulator LsrR (DeoR family)
MYSTEVLIEVSRRYYVEQQTQQQIAKEMFVSRSTVSRMIQRAMDLGIVKVKLIGQIERISFLEDLMKEEFGIKDVRICRAQNESKQKRILSTLAAETLDDILHDEITVGISRGRTMRRMVDAYRGKQYRGVEVVQMIGIADNENDNYEGPKVIDILCERLNARGYYLFAPFFVENDIARAEFKKIAPTVQTLKKFDECEYIFTGINGLGSSNTKNIWNFYAERFDNPNMIGTMLGYGFDINGNLIESDEYKKLMGKSIGEYKSNSKFVVVGSGESKAQAILGALRGGYIDVLVTDEKTAYMVYSMSKFL